MGRSQSLLARGTDRETEAEKREDSHPLSRSSVSREKGVLGCLWEPWEPRVHNDDDGTGDSIRYRGSGHNPSSAIQIQTKISLTCLPGGCVWPTGAPLRVNSCLRAEVVSLGGDLVQRRVMSTQPMHGLPSTV